MTNGGRTSDGPVRAECQVQFTSVKESMSGVHEAIKDLGKDIRKMSEANAEQRGEQRTQMKNVWAELTNGVKPALAKLPEDIASAVVSHSDGCLARRKFEKKVTDPRSSGNGPSRVLFSASLIRWLLYIGIAVGGVVAGYASSVVNGSGDKPAPVADP